MKTSRAAALLVALAAPFAIGVATTAHASAQPVANSAITESVSSPQDQYVPASTVSRQNAVESAEAYLSISAFSRQGLIEQLEYEGFSNADAGYAVDHITVDWNEQAAKSAKSYLEISSFSRQGLIEQLEYEGFTPAQARYGVTAVGL
ncbi:MULTISPECIES: Ltp family lipoprotein [unclassified Gordonia (in: high G+C Gram-positive bacteria)]